MRYHPALDGAPSSVSSTVTALVGGSLSTLGCLYILLRLRRLRAANQRRWHARYYLILMLAATNMVMALTAVISGGFFLVFGRIALAAGCTIGGMVEFWAQQAVDMSTILITVATFASVRQNALWAKRQYWIQTNIAPVVGLVMFLPLVNTIVSQIVWRFRSSEFAYCWIPRMPVYARWIAADGWRMLSVVGIVAAAPVPAVPHYSAIDSGPASNVTSDGRGLFSQSIHNVHQWALSKLGRSNAGTGAFGGLRAKTSVAPSTAKSPRSYYEQFKLSFVHNIVRWFTITTDIPSPTLLPSIFDSIGREGCRGATAASSSTMYCEFCRSSTDITASGQADNASRSDSQRSSLGGGEHSGGLRRWYSALARLVVRPNPRAADAAARPLPSRGLRRSHTAPALPRQAMGLCSCVFRRPVPSRRAGDALGAKSGASALLPAHAAFCDSDSDSGWGAYRTPSIGEYTGSGSSVRLPAVPDKIRALFGDSFRFQPGSQPQYVSIYACANYTGGLGTMYPSNVAVRSPQRTASSCSSVAEGVSAANGDAEAKMASLEGGQWEAAVASCISTRMASQQQLASCDGRASRLFVYPLAYVVVWLPSLVYAIVSTYVYHTGFSGPGRGHARRSVDMSGLPAHWTAGMNANHAWPYYRHATEDVSGSAQLYWLAIIQALHLLNGAADAVLFWLTEDAY
ncbi:hypothetical protein IWQ57_002917 [Coemansia nantahalensis]|uniref:Uncharacterized protein n=1 Tax=Coemansia nantahalensis TaxID=2789366 RepID=A0ACC1JYP6_9FUNG|nr:hypothetical protein IWQ57_002917 [Coemansia nantahalensis]